MPSTCAPSAHTLSGGACRGCVVKGCRVQMGRSSFGKFEIPFFSQKTELQSFRNWSRPAAQTFRSYGKIVFSRAAIVLTTSYQCPFQVRSHSLPLVKTFSQWLFVIHPFSLSNINVLLFETLSHQLPYAMASLKSIFPFLPVFRSCASPFTAKMTTSSSLDGRRNVNRGLLTELFHFSECGACWRVPILFAEHDWDSKVGCERGHCFLAAGRCCAEYENGKAKIADVCNFLCSHGWS